MYDLDKEWGFYCKNTANHLLQTSTILIIFIDKLQCKHEIFIYYHSIILLK